MDEPNRATDRELSASGAPLSRRTRAILGVVALVLVAAAAMGVWQTLMQPREPALRIPNMKMLAAPRPLPPLDIRDVDGEPVSFDRFRGKVVLLNLWATWCGPCRTEMPGLDRLQAKLGSARFEVVALSTDVGGVKAVREFYDSLSIQHLAIFVEGEANVLAALDAPGLPITLLVDAEGREVGRYLGAADWESAEFARVLDRYIGKSRASGKG